MTGPRDEHGRFMRRECRECGCGTLQPDGDGCWRCDGLIDPEDVTKELQPCPVFHIDGVTP